MYNSYITSTVLSFGTKGPFSFSFNNDCSNLFNERFDCNPLVSSSSSFSSRCCSCCNCCCESSFGTHKVALSPSLVYGLRQSSLIQFLPSRRFILGVRDRGHYRISGYGVDHGGNEVSCSFKETRGSDRIKREKFRRVNSSEKRCLRGFDDVDAVISLLSEEVSEECLGDRERNMGLSKRGKREKRSNYDCKSCRDREKNAGLGLLESSSKCEYESVIFESQNNARRRKEERENRERRESREEKEKKIATLKGENRRRKQSTSSVSSYYSLSSAENFESEREGEEETGSFIEELSSEHREDTGNRVNGFEGQVVENYEGRKEGDEKHGQVLQQYTSTARTNVDWDLRKKSEKKLSDSEEMQYSRESSQMRARTEKNFQGDYKKSSLQKENVQEEEKANVSVGLGRKTQYGQTNNQVSELSEFRKSYKEINDMQEIHGANVQTSSHHQKHFSRREENLTADTELFRERRDELHRKVGKIGGKETLRAETQQLTKRTDTGVIDAERVQKQAVSGIKIREEDTATSSNWETDNRRYQSGERITGKIESGSSQQFSERSDIRDSYSQKNSTLQSEIRKNHERNTIIASTSGEGVQDQRLRTDQNSRRKIQSEKGRQDVTNVSVNVTNVSMLHSSGTTSIANSQNIYVRGSQTGVQHVDLEHGNERSSQVVMIPPSPQLLDKNSTLDSSSGITAQEITMQSSGSSMGASELSQGMLYGSSGEGTSASYREPYARDHSTVSHEQHLGPPIREDSLGSAHRLEESATYFVGEFIEKARNDVSTSRIREDEASDAKLKYEGQEHKEKSVSQYSSEGLQLKDGDSLRSSGGSGVKGPSDEMWHVTDPSVQEPPQTEAAEGSTASENTIVRRNGGSLWSIISNIVRLRWGSRAETSKSAGKSGGKSTSNDSVRSETWFSGRDNDEISDGNGKGEKTSTLKEASSSHQLKQSRTSSQGQSDASGSMDTTDQFEEGIFSPSTTQKSGSSSKRISPPSEEENVGWSGSGKSSQIIPSGMEVTGQPVVSLPSSSISRPIVQESSGAHETVPYGSGIPERVEQPGRMESPEVSGSGVKEGELKQRRLQRNKQVIRDKFDEWEEAYLLESEQRKIDEMYMREALIEAKKAADTWEVPVGAVLVHGGKIIARGYNLVEELRDSTAHAEMICIREASNQLRTWRLAETTLYVTLEPCPMCAGAILQARIGTLVWGAPNKLLGADGSWIRLFPNGGGNGSEASDKPPAPVHPFHPNMKIRRGILSTDCAEAMQQFFQLRRRTKQKKEEEQPPQPSCLPLANRQSKFLHRMHNIFNVMFCL